MLGVEASARLEARVLAARPEPLDGHAGELRRTRLELREQLLDVAGGAGGVSVPPQAADATVGDETKYRNSRLDAATLARHRQAFEHILYGISERRGFILGDDDDGPGSIVGDESLELIEESDAHWLLGFVPTGDDDKEDRFLRKLRGTLRIAKDGGYLEYLDISATEPVSPAMGVKIRDFNTRFEFARIAHAPRLSSNSYARRTPIVTVSFS